MTSLVLFVSTKKVSFFFFDLHQLQFTFHMKLVLGRFTAENCAVEVIGQHFHTHVDTHQLGPVRSTPHPVSTETSDDGF
jgi:hypothetical protein